MSVRWATAGLLIGAIVGSAVVARADPPDKQQCIDAYDRSQRLRREGKLREAHVLLRVCADSTCPSVVQSECAQWVVDVEAATPTIVIEAKKGDGTQLGPGAQAWLDGEKADLSGRGIPVDPGDHVVKVRAADGKTVEQHVVAIEGQKLQKVLITVGPPVSPLLLHRARAKAPAAFWVLGAIGLASFVAMAALDISGKIDEGNMLATCAPTCDPGQVSDMRTRVLLGDVSMGVGIAAVLAASVVYFTRGWVFLAPTPTGAVGGVTARF